MTELSGILQALQEAEQAKVKMPQLEAEIWQLRRDLDHANTVIASREESIIRHKQEIDSLHEANRKLEVERDDAELRFLEVDERVDHTVGVLEDGKGALQDMAKALGALIDRLRPPKAEEPKVEPVYSMTSGGPALEPSERDVQAHEGQAIPHGAGAGAWSGQGGAGGGAYHGTIEGQSDAHPTASVTQEQAPQSATGSTHSGYATSEQPPHIPQAPAPSQHEEAGRSDANPSQATTSGEGQGVQSEAGQDRSQGEGLDHGGVHYPDTMTRTEQRQGKYAGVNYEDVPHYVPYSEWLAEGGTDVSYHYRSNRAKSGF